MKKILSLLALLCCSVAAWAQMPQFSNGDEEHYYYIKANIGDIYLADKGLGKAVRTDGLAVDPALQWKFVGDQNKCQIVNKLGNQLEHASLRTSFVKAKQTLLVIFAQSPDQLLRKWTKRSTVLDDPFADIVHCITFFLLFPPEFDEATCV